MKITSIYYYTFHIWYLISFYQQLPSNVLEGKPKDLDGGAVGILGWCCGRDPRPHQILLRDMVIQMPHFPLGKPSKVQPTAWTQCVFRFTNKWYRQRIHKCGHYPRLHELNGYLDLQINHIDREFARVVIILGLFKPYSWITWDHSCNIEICHYSNPQPLTYKVIGQKGFLRLCKLCTRVVISRLFLQRLKWHVMIDV